MVRYMSDQYFKVIKIEPTILMLVVGVIHHRMVMTNKFNFCIERKQNRRRPLVIEVLPKRSSCVLVRKVSG